MGEEKLRERDEYLAPLIDTSLSGDLDDAAMNFEDTIVETENNAEEFSEEVSRII